MAGVSSLKYIADYVQEKYGINARLLFGQMLVETGDGNSPLAVSAHNYGGITQVDPTPYPQPPQDGNLYYKVFASDEEYADYKGRYLIENYPGIAQAQTPEEFANILGNPGGTYHYFFPAKDSGKTLEQAIIEYGAGIRARSQEYDGTDAFADKTYVPGAGRYSDKNYLSQMTADDNFQRPWGNSLTNPDSMYYLKSIGQIEPKEKHEEGFFERAQKWISNNTVTFKDAFRQELDDSWLGRLVQTGMNNENSVAYGTVTSKLLQNNPQTQITNDDITQAKTLLGVQDGVDDERYRALMYAQANASNKAHFDLLINSKKDFFDRQQRIEEGGWNTGRVLGTLVGTAVDPINFIPVAGEEALTAKLGAKFGSKILSKIGEKAITKYAEIGVANGLLNMVDVGAREQLGGAKADYGSAFLVGSVSSFGLGLLLHPFTKGIGGKATKLEEAKLLKDSIDAVATMDDKVVKTKPILNIDLQKFAKKYGFEATAEGLGSFLKGNRKSKGYNIIKKELSEAMDTRLSNSDLDAIATHLATGEPVETISIPLSDGRSLTGGKVRSKEELVSLAQHDSPVLDNTPYVDIEPKPKDRITFRPEETQKEAQSVEELPKEDVPYAEEIADIQNGAPKYEERTEPPTGQTFRDEMKEALEERVRDPESVRKETQLGFLGKTKLGRKIGQWLDRGKFIGDISGLFMNSTSSTLRTLGKFLHRDTRQRYNANHLDAETVKTIIKNEYMPIIDEVLDTYKEYIQEKGWYKLPTNEQARLWSMDVVDAYHAVYRDKTKTLDELSEPLRKAVEGVKKFRRKDKQIMANSGLINDFSGSGIDELTRIPDAGKVEYINSLFASDEEYKKFMTEYFREAIRIDDNFIRHYMYDNDIIDELLVKYGNEMKKVDGEWIDLSTGEILTDDAIRERLIDKFTSIPSDFIDYLAKDMASWHTSLDNEKIFTLHPSKDGKQNYWKARVPLDYTVKKELPNGALFDYDSIRVKDIPMTMQYKANRTSGAVGLYQATGITDIAKDVKELHERVVEELDTSVRKGYITKTQAERELDALEHSLEGITGAYLFEGRQRGTDGVGAELSQLLRKLSYGANMMNAMGNQLSEGFGAIAINGSKALLHYIPFLKRRVEDLSDIHLTSEQKQRFIDEVLGYENAHDRFYSPGAQPSYARHELENQSTTLKLLGMANNVADTIAMVTSKLNMMNPLTTNSIQMIQADLFTDLIRFSQGKFKSTLRANIFSEEHFARAGITDVEAFLSTVRKYTKDGRLDMKKWAKEDFHSYVQMKSYLQNESQNIIIQPNIGNSDLASKHPFFALMMQFRNFSRIAVNQHMLRMLSKPEREHLIMTLSTAIPAGIYWAMRERLKAEEKFKDKPKEKQKWIEEHLTPENIITAGLLRSSTGSGLGYAQDAHSILTGSDSYKTTVSSYADDDNPLERLVKNAPPIATAYSGIRGVGHGIDSIWTHNKKESDKAGRELEKLYPIRKFMPIRVATALWSDTADRDKKQLTNFQQQLQEKNERRARRQEKKGLGKNDKTVQKQGILDYFK